MSDEWIKVLSDRFEWHEDQLLLAMYEVVRGVCGTVRIDANDKDDVAQQVLLSLMTTFRGRLPSDCETWTNLKRYVWTAARNQIYKFLQGRANTKERVGYPGDEVVTQKPVYDGELRPELGLHDLTPDQLDRLKGLVPEEERRLHQILGSFLNGRSREEIAADMGISVSTVFRDLVRLGLAKSNDGSLAPGAGPYITRNAVREILGTPTTDDP